MACQKQQLTSYLKVNQFTEGECSEHKEIPDEIPNEVVLVKSLVDRLFYY